MFLIHAEANGGTIIYANFKNITLYVMFKVVKSESYDFLKTQGQDVRKPIKPNPRLNVNRGFHLARLKWL